MFIRVNVVCYVTLSCLLIGQARSGQLQVLRRQIQDVLWEQFEQKTELDVLKEQMTEVLNSNALLLERLDAIERGHGGCSNKGCQDVRNLEMKYENLSMFTETIKVEMQAQKQQLLTLSRELDDTNGRISKLDSALFNVKGNIKTLQKNVTELHKVAEDISKYFKGSVNAYTPWSEWGSCSQGEQSRSRNCTLTKPGSNLCPSPLQETRPCQEVSCPVNYVRLEDNVREFCVKFVHSSLNHDEAKESCQADNGHLVFIDTMDKQDAVVGYVRPLVDESWPWIDGTRQGETWLNWRGEIMTFLLWNSDQPDTTYQQGISMNIGQGYRWHDDSGSHDFICEFDIN